MFDESNNIETQNDSLEVATKSPNNSESNNSQENSKNEIQIQTEKSMKTTVDNSQEYLVKYQMKSFKLLNKNAEGKNNRKRNWRAVSSLESPGLNAKKHLKNREILRPNRRISIRLKGQASPLYFPLTRYKSRSRKIINGLKTLPDLSSDKKKRGRPKRSDSNDKPIENNLTQGNNESIIQEISSTANTEYVENSQVNESEITPNQVRKKIKISTEKSPDILQTDDIENNTENKPKSRPWNIPRNKLPSFTIVNNPLMLKTSDFYGNKVILIEIIS